MGPRERPALVALFSWVCLESGFGRFFWHAQLDLWRGSSFCYGAGVRAAGHDWGLVMRLWYVGGGSTLR